MASDFTRSDFSRWSACLRRLAESIIVVTPPGAAPSPPTASTRSATFRRASAMRAPSDAMPRVEMGTVKDLPKGGGLGRPATLTFFRRGKWGAPVDAGWRR